MADLAARTSRRSLQHGPLRFRQPSFIHRWKVAASTRGGDHCPGQRPRAVRRSRGAVPDGFAVDYTQRQCQRFNVTAIRSARGTSSPMTRVRSPEGDFDGGEFETADAVSGRRGML
jgi:hypothetical protein